MNEVSLTIKSEVSVEELEELLENLKPIIKMVCPCELHTDIIKEGD